MYSLLSFTAQGRSFIVRGISLAEALHQLRAMGRGAVFRADAKPNDFPVYPRHNLKGR